MADPDPIAFGIDLDSVRDRVLGLGYFTSVEGIEDATTAIEFGSTQPPQAWVSIAAESAEPNKIIGRTAQRVNATLSVLYAENAARADGGRPDQVDRDKRAIIAQLRNWTPGGAIKACEYDRFRQRAIIDGVIYAEVLFLTSYRIE